MIAGKFPATNKNGYLTVYALIESRWAEIVAIKLPSIPGRKNKRVKMPLIGNLLKRYFSICFDIALEGGLVVFPNDIGSIRIKRKELLPWIMRKDHNESRLQGRDVYFTNLHSQCCYYKHFFTPGKGRKFHGLRASKPRRKMLNRRIMEGFKY